MPHPGSVGQEMQECIHECHECHRICLLTLSHCCQPGHQVEAARLGLLLDCIEMCQTGSNFMLRDSGSHGYVCAVCAQICDDFVRECEGASDDPQVQACAEACHRCAVSCHEMAKIYLRPRHS